jgi:hypothetical protein
MASVSQDITAAVVSEPAVLLLVSTWNRDVERRVHVLHHSREPNILKRCHPILVCVLDQCRREARAIYSFRLK